MGTPVRDAEVNDSWEVWDLRSLNRLYAGPDLMGMLSFLYDFCSVYGEDECDYLSAGCGLADLVVSGDQLRRVLGFKR